MTADTNTTQHSNCTDELVSVSRRLDALLNLLEKRKLSLAAGNTALSDANRRLAGASAGIDGINRTFDRMAASAEAGPLGGCHSVAARWPISSTVHDDSLPRSVRHPSPYAQ